jgi:integrase
VVRSRKREVHHGDGFRSSFRTWAAEVATFPPSIVEEAMGHRARNKVERAYQRSDVLEQRRRLMIAWESHCEPREAGKVVTFKKNAAISV